MLRHPEAYILTLNFEEEAIAPNKKARTTKMVILAIIEKGLNIETEIIVPHRSIHIRACLFDLIFPN